MESSFRNSTRKFTFILLITIGSFLLGFYTSPWLSGYTNTVEKVFIACSQQLKGVASFLGSLSGVFSYEKINGIFIKNFLQLDAFNLPVNSHSFLNKIFSIINSNFGTLFVLLIGLITFSLLFRVFVKSSAEFIFQFPIKKIVFEIICAPFYIVAAVPVMVYYASKGLINIFRASNELALSNEAAVNTTIKIQNESVSEPSHQLLMDMGEGESLKERSLQEADLTVNIKNGGPPKFELATSAHFEGEQPESSQVKIKTPQDIVEQHVIKIPSKVTFITKPSSKNSVNDLEQFVNLAKKFKDKNKKRLVIANFKGDSNRSFNKYLDEKIPFNQLIYSGFIENADLITHANDCFELKAAKMKKFFIEAEQKYDEIIIFTPETERYGWDNFFKYPISEVEL